MKKTIYIVDDEPTILQLERNILENRGFQVVAFQSPGEMLQMAREGLPAIFVVDIWMPEMSGIDVIRAIRGISTQVPIVVMTAESRIEVAIEALRAGANDFLRKPVVAEELALAVNRLLEVTTLKATLTSIQSDQAAPYPIESLIGDSPQMKAVRAFVERVVAFPDATLLLRGESGTGKNHVARVIHYNSSRAAGRFVDINCASIPDQLLESELFGYEKGAFTDARAPKMGLIEAGNLGTVLLDEINAMSPALQAKLLTVLEQRTFRRLGSTEDVDIDVRIMTTTNANLEEELFRQGFRDDLYYRINVVSIEIAPLRARPMDIEPLAMKFIAGFNRQFGRSVTGLTGDALKALNGYAWLGNVRELKNVIEHAMIFSDGQTLSATDLVLGKGVPSSSSHTSAFRPRSMVEMEREVITQTLLHTAGDTVKAASILGISRKTLWEKRKKYGLE
ncbi:MAG: sigma-54 dependent transcriptional regulator [Bacteroidetes bacterium]|jgi:DNA-binding NtrC family response regulator|nr:sigma-54 dependent transcriptional regulator [Bacteroidota bacterium]